MVLNNKSEKIIDVLLVCEGFMTNFHVQNFRIKRIKSILDKNNFNSMIFPYIENLPTFLQRKSRLVQILRRIYLIPAIINLIFRFMNFI